VAREGGASDSKLRTDGCIHHRGVNIGVAAPYGGWIGLLPTNELASRERVPTDGSISVLAAVAWYLARRQYWRRGRRYCVALTITWTPIRLTPTAGSLAHRGRDTGVRRYGAHACICLR
jgi:hypothetical protein